MTKPRRQIGAIPFERGAQGDLRVLLVTSRETHRWIVPKGWPMKGRRASEAAAQEAFEEAGVRGRIGRRELGRYTYPKRLRSGDFVECEVRLFPLRIEHLAESWPEQGQRERRWFTPQEAADLVQEAELGQLLGALDARLEARKKDGAVRKKAQPPKRRKKQPRARSARSD